MGNTNSSPRYRSRSPDPALDHTWSNSYPKVERAGNNRAWQQQQSHIPFQPAASSAMVNGHHSTPYDQFEQECIQHQQQQQQQQQTKLSDQQPLRFARYGPGAAEAPVQQAKKIRVLPTSANGGAVGTPGVGAVKLRPTDNGLALQKVGTLHIANRKLTELHHINLVTGEAQSLGKSNNMVADLGSDETRSPTPDYNDPNNKRGRSRNKKKVKAPTAPSTPAASAKSGSSRMDDQPASKSSGRGKLRLFKTKSIDNKSADAESGRIRARSMEYLRADVADETQEVRRRHSSREDLSGDESLLAFSKNGPVTVFSSQKKLNATDDEEWEDMPSLSRNTPPEAQPKQQFYFGMTPGDVAVATGGPQAPKTAQSLDLDEESRRVMEEFDAVLAESKSIERKSDTEEKQVRGRRRVVKSNSSSSSSDRPAPPPPVVRHHSSSHHRNLGNEEEEEEDDQDIALSLRPTLPKKPQQLPRFSPSAAWRALGQSSDHYSRSGSSKLNASSSKASDMSAMDLSDEEDEDEDVMEDRIAKNALRPVAPHPPRISNEKSADSGISGDAGSPDAAMASTGRDKPLAMSSPVPPAQQLQSNWTPQQDLLDDDSNSSSEADVPNGLCPPRHDPSPPKIIPKSQMFNDSMTDSNNPGSRSSSVSKGGRKYRKRNETGGSSRTDEGGQIPQKYNSLRKLKRSVSGAFATAFRRSKSPSCDDDCGNNAAAADDGNWMLSRSAPNSVINGSVGESPSIRKFHRSEADLLAQNGLHMGQLYPAYSQPSVLTQRIVYLPQYDSRLQHQRGRPVSMDQAELMRRARSADAVFLESKSLGQRMFGNVGNKKFTFQSTVRVHEKRLLEEKLSREAEHKERKRLQEMQAMQRVEEEFQRKRAREKANIRQQLRVLQLDHYKHQEQLMMLQQQQHHQQQRIARLDPEGAPSSISHHRTSSDELQQQKQSPVKGSVQKQPIAVIRSPPEPKRKEAAPAAPVLRGNKNGSNIRPDDEQQQPQRRTSKQIESAQQQQQQVQPQMDYRREVISSSRTRSAAPQTAAGPLPEVRTNGERNNNNVAQKKSSNIYRRLAEITSEEESIASPPPVPLLVVTSSPSRSSAAMNGNANKMQQTPHRSSAAAHVITNGTANNKVMTQELSEYRQERREYRDFRSPRIHQQQQLIAAPPTGRYYGQPGGHRIIPASASSSASSAASNKMQSDNYRWDFAHGGRGHHITAPVMKAAPPPPSVAWHHQATQPQVIRHHDYHHFYKMTSPTDVVMMHRTPQQRHH